MNHAETLRLLADDWRGMAAEARDDDRDDFAQDFEAKVAALEAGARALEALQALVAKLDEVHAHPAFKGAMVMAWLHGAEYDGPTYAEELNAAKAALSSLEGSGVIEKQD